ncbi:MAG: hypothetical protein PHW13_12355 [Methylococcales bacterium]|nr:hypothetical protein [Methylococcales bacterium]
MVYVTANQTGGMTTGIAAYDVSTTSQNFQLLNISGYYGGWRLADSCAGGSFRALYAVQAVPLAGGWQMMLTGLPLLLAGARRKRKTGCQSNQGKLFFSRFRAASGY